MTTRVIGNSTGVSNNQNNGRYKENQTETLNHPNTCQQRMTTSIARFIYITPTKQIFTICTSLNTPNTDSS